MSGNSGSRKTPNRGWFGKGRCGNPGGRPTASPTPQPSVFEILVDKTLTVVRDGMPREIGLREALQHRIYQDALKGKPMAMREVAKWILKRTLLWFAAIIEIVGGAQLRSACMSASGAKSSVTPGSMLT